MTDPHADLRAMLEALGDIKGSFSSATLQALSTHDICWLIRARALVRALLEERDKLVEQIEDQDDAPEWLSAVDEALGEDRKKAPFIDDAVRLLRKERDALKAEVVALGGVIRRGARVTALDVEQLTERAERAEAEVERIRSYVESKHNAYGDTGKELGMTRPASLLDAIKELVEENETLASMEARDLHREVEKLRAAKSAEDAKAPSVIRDGFPSDSLMEEAARLGRELASSLDDLLREARRRKEAGK